MKYKDYSRIFIGFLLLFLVVICVSYLKTKSIEEKNSKNYGFLESVYKIELIYHEIESISSNELSYLNYDLLNIKFSECENLIDQLENSQELISFSDSNYPIIELVLKLKSDFLIKREEIEEFKALNAIAVNSLRYLESDPWIYEEKNRTKVFMKIAMLGVDKSLNIDSIQKEINDIKINKEEDEIYKIHALNILNASKKIAEISTLFAPEKNTITASLKKLMLKKFDAEKNADKLIKDALYVASFFGLLSLIAVFLLLSKNKKELYKFHSAIDKSDSFVALTDAKNNITYLNEAFVKAAGNGEFVSKTILSVFEYDRYVFDEIFASLEQRIPYRGELKINQEGEYIYVKIMVLGLYDNEKLSAVLYMGMDITNEKRLEDSLTQVNKNLNLLVEQKVKEIKQKDVALMQHARFAAMAEAISSIAHQWRQPLNALGIIIQDIKMAAEYEELTKAYIDDSVLKSKDIISQMSKTIDAFRGFLKVGYEREIFDVSFAVQKAVLLCDSGFKNALITLAVEYPEEHLKIDGYLGDLVQSLLSILINSKENFENKNIKNGITKIITYLDGEFVKIVIKDNGGGCDENVLQKMFEPYFSTKDAQLGSGIGLFMVKTVVEKNMGGKVEAYNEEEGLRLTLSLPAYKEAAI
jgi:PAS domain S-box-containing protein